MLKNLKNKKKKRGFTLIELVIVIAIIAILALLAIPKFSEIRQSANEKSDIANAKTIANAVTALVADESLTIPTTTDLVIDTSTVDAQADLIEDYLQNVPKPKSQTGNFSVSIDAKGNVIVKAGTTTFFPQ